MKVGSVQYFLWDIKLIFTNCEKQQEFHAVLTLKKQSKNRIKIDKIWV